MFSTCTINPLENEGNVRWALDNFPLELLPQEPRLGGYGLPNAGLSDEECKLVQRFTPGLGGTDDMAGFFISKFRKTAEYK